MTHNRGLSDSDVPSHHRANRPRFIRAVCKWVLQGSGWKVTGKIPEDKKMVLVLGPHTSNWDYVISMLAMVTLDIRLSYMAKHTLFEIPVLKSLMRVLGGVPVNRKNPAGFVEDISGLIRNSDKIILAITPEGTRSPVKKLKTGFSRIASEVPCQVLPLLLDFSKKEFLLWDAFTPSDNPDRDAERVHKLFEKAAPKVPKKFIPLGKD